jgi:hypothetical protein
MPQEILARAPYRYAVGRHALTTLAVGAPPGGTRLASRSGVNGRGPGRRRLTCQWARPNAGPMRRAWAQMAMRGSTRSRQRTPRRGDVRSPRSRPYTEDGSSHPIALQTGCSGGRPPQGSPPQPACSARPLTSMLTMLRSTPPRGLATRGMSPRAVRRRNPSSCPRWKQRLGPWRRRR